MKMKLEYCHMLKISTWQHDIRDLLSWHLDSGGVLLLTPAGLDPHQGELGLDGLLCLGLL